MGSCGGRRALRAIVRDGRHELQGPGLGVGFFDVFTLLHGPYVTRGRFEGIVPYIVLTARTRQCTEPMNDGTPMERVELALVDCIGPRRDDLADVREPHVVARGAGHRVHRARPGCDGRIASGRVSHSTLKPNGFVQAVTPPAVRARTRP